jgi:competence protein ComEC
MPLLWLSLAFLIGILLAANLPLDAREWLLLGVLTLPLALLHPLAFRIMVYAPALPRAAVSLLPHRILLNSLWIITRFARQRLPVPLFSLLLVACLGAARCQLALPDAYDPQFIAAYNNTDGEVWVEGVVVQPPDVRDAYTNLRIEVERLGAAGEAASSPVHGKMLAAAWEAQEWRYGDRLRLLGVLETPPQGELFSYRDYLARQGIYTVMQPDKIELLERGRGNPFLARLYALRQRLLDLVYQYYPDPEASLIAGILLGIESGIPTEVERAFQDSGTAHIIAISGFNIVILCGLFTALFGLLFGRWRGAFLTLLCIAMYTLLVGAGASAVRAALMGGIALFAVQLGRRQAGLNSLAFVAALMALFNPFILWDVGFQLSFLATLGLVLYAAPLSAAFTRLAGRYLPEQSARRLSKPAGEYLLFTLAAALTTLPVIAYHFRRLSLVSIPANAAILPAQPPLMVLGGVSLLAGLVLEPLGQLAAYLTWPFAAYTIRMAELFASLPHSAIPLGAVPLLWVLIFYALLFGLTFSWGRLRLWFASRHGRSSSSLSALPIALLALLGITAVLVWRAYYITPDGRLHLTLLDVGSGDALLIQTPDGRFLLVDGGPSPSKLSDALGRRLPLVGRRLDWLVVAAAGEEQIGSLPAVIERYPPDQVLWAGPQDGTPEARRLQEQLSQMGIMPVSAQTGHMLDLGQGAQLQVLAAGPRGAVLLLEWGNFRLLLPAGIDFETLERLQADPSLTPVTALLLAESGYAPANPPGWIEVLRPQVVLLSVAAGDREGRPDPETLQAVQGYTLLRTDINGWIELATDGEQLWVEAAR